MGFWHTGYMEHHEDDFFGSRPRNSAVLLPPPVYPCPHCARTFGAPDKLERHLFDGHPFARPLLLFRGRECGRARFTITDPTVATDWVALDCERTTLNGQDIPPESLGASLESLRHTVATVVLHGAASTEVADLEFAVAEPADLDCIDERLLELVRGHQLTMASIQAFILATASYRTAARYRDGIAIYLYGVLAREQSPDSGLARDDYRGRFDEAVELLHTFDRPPADAICALVAFHFNQFAQAAIRTRSPRIAWAAARFASILGAGTVDLEAGPAPDRAGLDFVLSDAYLEQVLTWSCLPLDEGGSTLIDAMEASLPGLEPLDQLKVRVLCAEHALAAGAVDRGLSQANELRHNAATADWAREYVAESKS